MVRVDPIERKIRKYIRTNKLFKKNDKIVADGISYSVLKRILEGLPITLVRGKNKKKGYKLVITYTMDDYICEFLSRIFLNKKVKKDKFISIFKTVTDDELKKYCKKNKIRFKPNKKDKRIMDLIETVAKNHQETKVSLLKTSDEIKGL